MYRGLQQRVYRMLQDHDWSRERARKDAALVWLLTEQKHWDGHITAFTKQELVDLAKDFNSADRYWRLLTATHSELRGTDYQTKKIVVQRKLIGLDYRPGYQQDVKKLSTIT